MFSLVFHKGYERSYMHCCRKVSLFMYFFCSACMLHLYPHESFQKVFLKLFTCYKIYFTLQINIFSDNDYLKLIIILMVYVAGIYAILY